MDKWKDENKEFALLLDDTFYATLGCTILDILKHSDIISYVLIKTSYYEYPQNSIRIKDNYLMSNKIRSSIVNLPLKLPMICPPKPYDANRLGGYLLNDEKFSEQLFVEKKLML